LSVGFGVNCRW